MRVSSSRSSRAMPVSMTVSGRPNMAATAAASVVQRRVAVLGQPDDPPVVAEVVRPQFRVPVQAQLGEYRPAERADQEVGQQVGARARRRAAPPPGTARPAGHSSAARAAAAGPAGRTAHPAPRTCRSPRRPPRPAGRGPAPPRPAARPAARSGRAGCAAATAGCAARPASDGVPRSPGSAPQARRTRSPRPAAVSDICRLRRPLAAGPGTGRTTVGRVAGGRRGPGTAAAPRPGLRPWARGRVRAHAHVGRVAGGRRGPGIGVRQGKRAG